LEQGRVELQLKQSDLLRLVLQHVIDRRPLAERSNLSLWLDDTQTPAPVFIDESLIGQVFSILLTNALNYTPPGGKIQVGFCHKEQDLEEFCGFYVKDNGPGIAPEDQSQLFQRFFRGQVGRKSGAGGTGLGLSIAEEIVRQHHGHIGVESEGIVGCGTTFRVWLPLAKSQYSMAQRRVTMD